MQETCSTRRKGRGRTAAPAVAAAAAALVAAVVVVVVEAAPTDRHPATNLQAYCDLDPDVRPPHPTTLRDMRWIHFPKTGTSFGTCLAHYTCPGLDPNAYPNRAESPNGNYMQYFAETYMNSSTCDGVVNLRESHGHTPLREREIAAGGIVGMFRDPRHRDYSGWLVHGRRGESPLHPEQLSDYVHLHRACQMRMLLGFECNRVDSVSELAVQISRQDVEYALALLDSKFAFVGLTEFWRESICLFHAMFGGDITPHEMANVRPGASVRVRVRPRPSDIDTAADAHDWELYQHAASIFVSRLRKYGIRVPPALAILVA
ncbi:hypothetical protein PTSG_09780 [Salpingoeca rosetta]|uniref:Uncharacterized protein n=1 Tax=Salpingoeca rosetta (strain ATCC 50818 / BSB-021) TaxID=946362 RepID=F2UP15_SALR5|nr:uncharacterized protein PTSG_09780 [Salpingoeca rosetta]EGD79370.1 hypothetical protein PTSG_09780 [Salpingoeca rosetta]|eukprot:XP_004989139.1 hypothetical protein PTSG_09780 [Salpingoeca rosetta]